MSDIPKSQQGGLDRFYETMEQDDPQRIEYENRKLFIRKRDSVCDQCMSLFVENGLRVHEALSVLERLTDLVESCSKTALIQPD